MRGELDLNRRRSRMLVLSASRASVLVDDICERSIATVDIHPERVEKGEW